MEIKDSISEFNLIRAAQNGDKKAFGLIMTKFERSIYHVILKMVHNRADAEDLTMQTFEKAYRFIHLYSEDFTFSSWIFKIATNSCIDFIRQKKLMISSTSLNASATDSPDDGNNSFVVQDQNPNPEAEIIQSQRAKRVSEMIKKIPEKYRIFLELRYFEELSYEEISERTDIPVGTVKAKLHRAKELLYQLYNPKKNQY
ncbi:MAG TPA: sigma-70 family RNA polymerase sigma factor [Chitinophagales bacterium]